MPLVPYAVLSPTLLCFNHSNRRSACSNSGSVIITSFLIWISICLLYFWQCHQRFLGGGRACIDAMISEHETLLTVGPMKHEPPQALSQGSTAHYPRTYILWRTATPIPHLSPFSFSLLYLRFSCTTHGRHQESNCTLPHFAVSPIGYGCTWKTPGAAINSKLHAWLLF